MTKLPKPGPRGWLALAVVTVIYGVAAVTDFIWDAIHGQLTWYHVTTPLWLLGVYWLARGTVERSRRT